MNENEQEHMIADKGLTAPRVTAQDIDDTIVHEYYHRLPGTTLTICVLTLRNGTHVVGESACVSPENFNLEIGQRVAYNNARGKVWALEGYLLRHKLMQGAH